MGLWWFDGMRLCKDGTGVQTHDLAEAAAPFPAPAVIATAEIAVIILQVLSASCIQQAKVNEQEEKSLQQLAQEALQAPAAQATKHACRYISS